MMEFNDKVWYKQFQCPECGYKSCVTNVCRSCREMPITHELTRPVWCEPHKTYHYREGGSELYDFKGEKTPLSHESIMMVETGWAERFNPNLERTERRKIKNLPEDAIVG